MDTWLSFCLGDKHLQSQEQGKGMMETSSCALPRTEPRAVTIAPSLVPAFCSNSSNILSFPGLYEDLIFPRVSYQVCW